MSWWGPKKDKPGLSASTSLQAFFEAARTCQNDAAVIQLCQHTLPHATRPQPTEFEAEVRSVLARTLVHDTRSGSPKPLRAAIAQTRLALRFYTFERHPAAWVVSQMTLAVAWRNLTDGSAARNTDRAIIHNRRALQYLAPGTPEWTDTQNNIGNAWRSRSRGDRRKNFEEAIRALTICVEAIDQNVDPLRHARAVNNLGIATSLRLEGDRATNTANALKYFDTSTEAFRAMNAWPLLADALNDYAIVLLGKQGGERAKDEAEAVARAEESLAIRQALPNAGLDLLKSYKILARLHMSIASGDRGQNLEKAQHYLFAASKCWKDTQSTEHAAGIFIAQAQIELERSEFDSHAALNAFMFLDQAQTQLARINAASPDFHLAKGDALVKAKIGGVGPSTAAAIVEYGHAANVASSTDRSLWSEACRRLTATLVSAADATGQDALLRQAMEITTATVFQLKRQSEPIRWAMQVNLLGAIRLRRGEVDQAIHSQRVALQEVTSADHPDLYRKVQLDLAAVLLQAEQWEACLDALEAAMAVSRQRFLDAYSDAGQRRELARDGTAYHQAAYCLLKLGRPLQALTMIERGKARLLKGAFDRAVLAGDHADIPLAQAFREADLEVRALEYRQRQPAWLRTDTTALLDNGAALQAARRRRDDIGVHILQPGAGRHVDPDDIVALCAKVPKHHVLVIPIVTTIGTLVMVVRPGDGVEPSIHVIEIGAFTAAGLSLLIDGHPWEQPTKVMTLAQLEAMGGSPPERGPSWMALLQERTGPVAEWTTKAEGVSGELWTGLIGPIVERLPETGYQALRDTLVILAPGKLNLAPLHASWRSIDGVKRFLLDDHIVAYASSLRQIAVGAGKHNVTESTPIFIVGAADANLEWANLERELAATSFAQVNHLPGASRAALMDRARDARYLHFICHGRHDWSDPIGSALILSNAEELTLAEIYLMDLSACRLAMLSACETGLTDTSFIPDEFVGLATGFLSVGAAAVVSTLWRLNDQSAPLLVYQFYKSHIADKMTVPAALRAAQLWLRDATREALLAELKRLEEAMSGDQDVARSAITDMRAKLYEIAKPGERPFASLYYWSPWHVLGI